MFFADELFVTNLTSETTQKELSDLFKPHGAVKECWVAHKKHGAGTNTTIFGSVRMDSHEAAVSAKKSFDGADYNGKRLSVKWANNQRVLWVGGLHMSVTNEELQAAFSQFGTVSRAVVVADANGVSQRFGFVWYEDKRDASKALTSCQEGAFVFASSAEPVRVEYARYQDVSYGFTNEVKKGKVTDPSTDPKVAVNQAHIATPNSAEYQQANAVKQLYKEYQQTKAWWKQRIAEASVKQPVLAPQPAAPSWPGAPATAPQAQGPATVPGSSYGAPYAPVPRPGPPTPAAPPAFPPARPAVVTPPAYPPAQSYQQQGAYPTYPNAGQPQPAAPPSAAPPTYPPAGQPNQVAPPQAPYGAAPTPPAYPTSQPYQNGPPAQPAAPQYQNQAYQAPPQGFQPQAPTQYPPAQQSYQPAGQAPSYQTQPATYQNQAPAPPQASTPGFHPAPPSSYTPQGGTPYPTNTPPNGPQYPVGAPANGGSPFSPTGKPPGAGPAPALPHSQAPRPASGYQSGYPPSAPTQGVAAPPRPAANTGYQSGYPVQQQQHYGNTPPKQEFPAGQYNKPAGQDRMAFNPNLHPSLQPR